MTTVGYGDYATATTLGRVVWVVVAILGIVVVSLIVTATSSVLEFNFSED